MLEDDLRSNQTTGEVVAPPTIRSSKFFKHARFPWNHRNMVDFYITMLDLTSNPFISSGKWHLSWRIVLGSDPLGRPPRKVNLNTSPTWIVGTYWRGFLQAHGKNCSKEVRTPFPTSPITKYHQINLNLGYLYHTFDTGIKFSWLPMHSSIKHRQQKQKSNGLLKAPRSWWQIQAFTQPRRGRGTEFLRTCGKLVNQRWCRLVPHHKLGEGIPKHKLW